MVRMETEEPKTGSILLPVAPKTSCLVGRAASMLDLGCCSLKPALSMGLCGRKIRLSWRAVTAREADEVYHRQVHFAEDCQSVVPEHACSLDAVHLYGVQECSCSKRPSWGSVHRRGWNQTASQLS
jgi:hypothetical protein